MHGVLGLADANAALWQAGSGRYSLIASQLTSLLASRPRQLELSRHIALGRRQFVCSGWMGWMCAAAKLSDSSRARFVDNKMVKAVPEVCTYASTPAAVRT